MQGATWRQLSDQLLAAAFTGSLARCQFILQTSQLLLLVEDLDRVTDSNGNTPFMLACAQGHLDVANYFLSEYGVNKNQTNTYNLTALHQSAVARHQDIVEFLLRIGTDVNAEDKHGNTPFIKACVAGDLGIAGLLFDHGADLDHPNREGNTALHRSVSNGHEHIISFLLQKGADKNARNHRNETPLMVACTRCPFFVRHAILSMLQRHASSLASVSERTASNTTSSYGTSGIAPTRGSTAPGSSQRSFRYGVRTGAPAMFVISGPLPVIQVNVTSASSTFLDDASSMNDLSVASF